MTNVLTLRMDTGSQEFFEHMRQTYYPPGRNQIGAHLTLFHTLPDTLEVCSVLREITTTQACFEMNVTGLRSLGRGVAYTCQSPDLLELHGALAGRFAHDLNAQDKQRFKPHVVIQNKATPEVARALLDRLQRNFHALEVQGLGLDLWHYLGGPWELAQSFPFSG